MKTNKRYELSLAEGKASLVDVTSIGLSEGFDDTEELRVGIWICIQELPEPLRSQVWHIVDSLISRLEGNNLRAGDVVGPANRILPDELDFPRYH